MRSPKLTAKQFEREYARVSRMSVKQLRATGLVVRRCDCGDPTCRGWRVVAGDLVKPT